MQKPIISVIMAVHNGEEYLKSSIDSVLTQTYRNFEFIIIDDASTDLTPVILRKYSKKDRRIKIITNPKNVGLTKSLNKGIKIARGEFMARQDADDISLPSRFEKQINYLDSHENVVLLGTSAYIIDKDNTIITKIVPPQSDEKIRKRLYSQNCIFHGSIMFRRKVGAYRENFRFSQDYDLYLRALEIGKIETLPEALYMHRFTKEQVSVTRLKEQTFFADLARKFAMERRKYGQDTYHYFFTKYGVPDFQKSSKMDLNLVYNYKLCTLLLMANEIKKARKNIIELINEKIPYVLRIKLLIYLLFTLLDKKSRGRVLDVRDFLKTLRLRLSC